MILKASQRKGGKNLAEHLMRGDTNEHVTVHEVSGFISDDIAEAFQEAQALAMGTHCSQYLFSLSLNPPELENVSIADFEAAIAEIEKSLGLVGQARVIVFHEKNGRRHCHCVWSRIYHNGDKFKAINMAHFKRKLNTIAKELFLKHGWKLPKGFTKTADKTNYTLAEWQQAERLKDDPTLLKNFFKNCWEQSDSKQSFATVLQESGYYLAKGDRRGYVAVDYQGEVYSLSRWLNVKTKELKAKLGDHQDLPSANQAREFAESRMTDAMKQYLAEKRVQAKERRAPLVQELRELVKHQRQQRQDLLERQQQRDVTERKDRLSQFRSGLSGIWDLVTGKTSKIIEQNAEAIELNQARDQAEMHEMVQKHLAESRELHKTIKFYKTQEQQEEWRLKRQIAAHVNEATEPERHIRQDNISDKLIALESGITAMSADIIALQGSLDNAMLSEDMKAKIRNLIEQAKDIVLFKKIKEKQEKSNLKTKEEDLLKTQQKLFHTMQQYEALKQQQAEQQRVIAFNRAFYAHIQAVPYNLNGVPMHKIKIVDKPLDTKAFKQKIQYQSTDTLLRNIKTKPPKKQVVNAADLAKSTASISEILKRAKIKDTPPPKTEQHKTSKLKPSV